MEISGSIGKQIKGIEEGSIKVQIQSTRALINHVIQQNISETEKQVRAMHGITIIGDLTTTFCKVIIKIFLFMKRMFYLKFKF